MGASLPNKVSQWFFLIGLCAFAWRLTQQRSGSTQAGLWCVIAIIYLALAAWDSLPGGNGSWEVEVTFWF